MSDDQTPPVLNNHQAARSLTRERRAELVALWETGKPVRLIAEALCMSKGAVVGNIRRMQMQGLLQQRGNPIPRRRNAEGVLTQVVSRETLQAQFQAEERERQAAEAAKAEAERLAREKAEAAARVKQAKAAAKPKPEPKGTAGRVVGKIVRSAHAVVPVAPPKAEKVVIRELIIPPLPPPRRYGRTLHQIMAQARAIDLPLAALKPDGSPFFFFARDEAEASVPPPPERRGCPWIVSEPNDGPRPWEHAIACGARVKGSNIYCPEHAKLASISSRSLPFIPFTKDRP